METSVVVEEANKATEGASDNERLVVVVDVGAEAEATITSVPATAIESQKKKNQIQVSNTKKPLLFYLNLAKRYIKQYNDVELSALGMAIPTVVTISETLKRNGLAIEKKIVISSVVSKEDEKGRIVQKPQLEIMLEKAEKLEETVVATACEKAATLKT
ncbi:hypothetical protein CJ030_MR3G008412 [Morella rubra]|uniref:DNA/RNA-binding protein Alba-like domain-containing protein n=1 Tax=Morella rubra TaxID=262757 RepID=A0A6A1W1P3_9ROSI|nr:hypothetical protein CJ030_MR3G008412 [Morella rubra]